MTEKRKPTFRSFWIKAIMAAIMAHTAKGISRMLALDRENSSLGIPI